MVVARFRENVTVIIMPVEAILCVYSCSTGTIYLNSIPHPNFYITHLLFFMQIIKKTREMFGKMDISVFYPMYKAFIIWSNEVNATCGMHKYLHLLD